MKGSTHPVRRLLALLLCLAGLIALAVPATAAVQNKTPAAADVANEKIYATYVHYYASAGSAVIGQLENGKTVQVLGQSGQFYKVDLYGMTGYIAAVQLRQDADGTYYVDCKAGNPDTRILTLRQLPDALTLRHRIMDVANKQLGTPYVYGGTRPGGFDCSGFVFYVYNQSGVSLNRLATVQLKSGVAVSRENMTIGDLVFFREPWESTILSHVGIYAGNNQIIHAGTGGICYASLDNAWYDQNFLCARRIINTPALQLELQPAPAADGESCTVRSISGRTAH